MPNVKRFYLEETEYLMDSKGRTFMHPKNENAVGTNRKILRCIITELNTACQGLYIGQLGELVYRVREYYQGQGKNQEETEKELEKMNKAYSGNYLQMFLALNEILTEKDRIAYYVLSPISDSWITITELGLLEYLGSEFTGYRKKPSPIYKRYSAKYPGEDREYLKQKGLFLQHLFRKNLKKRKYSLWHDKNGKERFILGGSFQTDGHSVSVIVHDMSNTKKKEKFHPGSLNLVDLGKDFQKPKRPVSDKLPKDYKPDQIVGVDNGVRYAVGLCAKKLVGTEEEKRQFNGLTITRNSLFIPTRKFNKWLSKEKRSSEIDVYGLEGDLARREGEPYDEYVVRYWKIYNELTHFYNSQKMKRHREYLTKAQRATFDRAVNSILKTVGMNSFTKSDGKTCFVFGTIIYL